MTTQPEERTPLPREESPSPVVGNAEAQTELFAKIADDKAASLNKAADSLDKKERRDRRDDEDLSRMADDLRRRAECCTEIAAAIRALSAAPVPVGDEPLPWGVYYSADADNFYSFGTNTGMGQAFYVKWYDKKHLFPTSRPSIVVDEDDGDCIRTLEGEDPFPTPRSATGTKGSDNV